MMEKEVLSFQLDGEALELLDKEVANYSGMSRGQVARLLVLRSLRDQTAHELKADLYLVRNDVEMQNARLEAIQESAERISASFVDLFEATGEILDRLEAIAPRS
jgi:hypothetical protein